MKREKIVSFLLFFVGSCMILTQNVYAYVDISATTYIVQIVAGLVVIVGTFIGVGISMFKKKMKEKFNVDLEKKEREEDIVVYDEKDEK